MKGVIANDTHAKFFCQSVQGFWSSDPPPKKNIIISIGLADGSYNSVSTAVLQCGLWAKCAAVHVSINRHRWSDMNVCHAAWAARWEEEMGGEENRGVWWHQPVSQTAASERASDEEIEWHCTSTVLYNGKSCTLPSCTVTVAQCQCHAATTTSRDVVHRHLWGVTAVVYRGHTQDAILWDNQTISWLESAAVLTSPLWGGPHL